MAAPMRRVLKDDDNVWESVAGFRVLPVVFAERGRSHSLKETAELTKTIANPTQKIIMDQIVFLECAGPNSFRSTMMSIAPTIASIPPTRFAYGRGPRRVPTIRSSRPVLF